MATFDYARAQATADRLLRRFGQAGAIRRATPGGGPSYDPGEPTITDYAATFAVMEYNQRDIDGTLIKAGDRRILVSPELDIEPVTTDKIVIGGAAYTIVRVSPFAPAGIVVYFEVQARS